MELAELKKEQLKLAYKVQVRDGFDQIKTIGAVECVTFGESILASVVVCEYPSMRVIEKQTEILLNPLPYRPNFVAFREMPAIIDAVNKLDQDPDILLVKGAGINHPRKLGIASHLGLALNIPTIGVMDKLNYGHIEKGNILIKGDVVGFEITTREHAKPIYCSPGHLVSLGTVLQIIPKTIQFPHKLPEPMHIAHKIGKKKVKNG
jgi:deoxyribonuclease V